MVESSELFTNSNEVQHLLEGRIDVQLITHFECVDDVFIFDETLLDEISKNPEREEPGKRCVVSLHRLKTLRPAWNDSLLPTLESFHRQNVHSYKSIYLYDGKVLYELIWNRYTDGLYLWIEKCSFLPPENFNNKDLIYLSDYLTFAARCFINTFVRPATMAKDIHDYVYKGSKPVGLQLGQPLTYTSLRENLITSLNELFNG